MAKNVIAIVLAAGQSSRMGDINKLTRLWRGKALVSHVIDAALNSSVAGVIVVTGHEASEVNALVDERVQTVFNPDFGSGMASSLRTGLQQAQSDGADAVLVLLGDMPLVIGPLINALLKAFEAAPDDSIVQATCDGESGNPVLIPKSDFQAVLSVDGDRGARRIIEQNRDRVLHVEIGEAARRDFDTLEAFDPG